VLVKEEMRRVLAYLTYRAAWWKGRVGMRSNVPYALQCGLSAYAQQQAWICLDLHKRFQHNWADTDRWIEFNNPSSESSVESASESHSEL
jgi:hypothetical protein